MDYSNSVADPCSCINTTLVESPRRSSASSASSLHEFQFWSSSAGDHPADLLTADELFVDGVLLPLRLLSLHRPESAAMTTWTEPAEAQLEASRAEPAELTALTEPTEAQAPEDLAAEVAGGQQPQPPCSSSSSACTGPEISPASITCAPTTASKRWKDIFKVGEKKGPPTAEAEKKRKKNVGGGTAHEEQHLNISIWPFARSSSAGSSASRGRRKSATVSGRKVNSAPCSRSNSRGDSSKSSASSTAAGGRRWAGAASPGRGGGGVHVGRLSPVWQIRRPGQKDKLSSAGGRKGSGDGVGFRVLNLNVNTCIGYCSQGSCRSDDRDGAAGVARTAAAVGGGSGGGMGLFNPLKTLFSKKMVY